MPSMDDMYRARRGYVYVCMCVQSIKCKKINEIY